jgi:hypothetical protein
MMGAGGFKGLQDMIDGGGAGASGPMFEGGAISDIANQIGIKPHGFEQRQQAMGQVRPQMRPQMGQPMGQPPMQQPPQAQSASMQSPGVQSHPLPPGQQSPQFSPMMQYYQMLEMQRRQQGLI